MARDYASAVRAGTMEAGRLHRAMNSRQLAEQEGAMVDIFAAIHALDVPLLLKPLRGLLGAYLSEPIPGILVTTERPMSIQRFTAAHELGHFAMQHEPSLDDETILRRMPSSPEPTSEYQEAEADAFAIAFMMPKSLIISHCMRQGWQTLHLGNPGHVYQLSLRLGASYEATYRTLRRYDLITHQTMVALGTIKPRDIKIALLRGYRPPDYRGDVWRLTSRDAGTRIDGSRNDLFVVRVKEHSGSGYLWDFDQLRASGFAIVKDDREAEEEEEVGGPVVRRVTAAPIEAPRGSLELEEYRPWAPMPALNRLSLKFDLSGPELEGLSRAEKRSRLAA